MEYLNSGISEEETLQVALQSGIIDINEISMRIEDMKRKEILSNHPYSIWYSETDNLWKTYLPDIENKNGRIFRKRKNKKDLEDLIVKYYISHQQEIYLKDVFTEWSESKLKYGEIQKQSYDRYCTDFQRFFSSAHPICRKKFKNITYPDLTDFIKSSIHEKHLTRKSYAGLRLLVRGIFKYGKSKGYTQLSMSEFFGDLELPNNIFEKKLTNKRKEVFSEEEIPILTSYLKHNIDIWNMGLLLQLQTGMRIGELSALKPEDIQSHYIRVCRTEVKYRDDNGKWKVEIKAFAKTDAGNRDVYFPDSVKWTLAQIQKLNPHGEYLFMNNGKRIRENTFNKRLSSICDILKIDHRSTHKIRKTYGTTLLDNNVDDSIVSEQMGHSDIATTRQLYYFCNKSEKTKIAQINNAINF